MKTVLLILMMALSLRSELVYISKIKTNDVLVIYVTENQPLAERTGLVVELTKNKLLAGNKKDVWCLVRTRGQSSLIVYVSKNKSVGIPIYIQNGKFNTEDIELGYGSDVEFTINNLLIPHEIYGFQFFYLPRIPARRKERDKEIYRIQSKQNGSAGSCYEMGILVFRKVQKRVVSR